MRLILAILVAMLLAAPLASHTDATPSPSPGTVRVEFYGNAAWASTVYSVVQELNAVTWNMSRAPTFYMADMQDKPCSQMQWPVPDRVYQVCTMPDVPGALAYTWSNPIRQAATVQIENSAATWPMMRALVCHEFVHATTNALDGPFIYPDTSCMRGYLDHFGSWDIANMWWWWG